MVADSEALLKIGHFFSSTSHLPLHLLRSARVRCFLVVLQNWLFLFCWISAYFASEMSKKISYNYSKAGLPSQKFQLSVWLGNLGNEREIGKRKREANLHSQLNDTISKA